MSTHHLLIEQIADEIAEGRREPPTPDEVGVYADDLPDVSDLSIGAAAQMIGIEATTVRYYEDAGLLSVPRRGNGHRSFDRDALGELLFVHRMRLSGLPVRDIARLQTLLRRDTAEAQRDARELLEAHALEVRRQIAQLQISLAITEHKTDYLAPLDSHHLTQGEQP
ncbi:MerR family transcriptional regulator [Brevibacterium linens]|uniref:DNA-binding transcriptional regulator, MerR family n=1 Tax=Brevibacterium linens TaxID=1703 RepID=A0A2H1I6T5_BRELN|nr:MerR family transcriptional regulator [Brevibacterium linens]SMX70824.1 DNA-binding transcriptional regulator, MerR family [Brevibacterium linens]